MTAIDAIRREIAEHRRTLAALESALGVLTGEPAAETPPGKAAAPRPTSTGAPPRNAASVNAVLRALRDHGPLRKSELIDTCGLSAPTVSRITGTQPLLFKQTGNRLSPWTLTEAGQARAQSL